jgi:hypothetical protein
MADLFANPFKRMDYLSFLTLAGNSNFLSDDLKSNLTHISVIFIVLRITGYNPKFIRMGTDSLMF